jgi:hypothetical protein
VKQTGDTEMKHSNFYKFGRALVVIVGALSSYSAIAGPVLTVEETTPVVQQVITVKLSPGLCWGAQAQVRHILCGIKPNDLGLPRGGKIIGDVDAKEKGLSVDSGDATLISIDVANQDWAATTRTDLADGKMSVKLLYQGPSIQN